MYWNIGAFFALFLTLCATAWAAWAASKAAKAADDVVTLTRETIERQLRPYLYFIESDHPAPITRDTVLKFRLKNFGQTPALNVRLARGSEHFERPIGNAVIELEDDIEEIRSIGPGQDTGLMLDLGALPSDQWNSFLGGGVMVTRMRADYTTQTGVEDFDEVIWSLDRAGLSSGAIEIVGHHERAK